MRNKSKWFATAGVVLLAAATLAACGNKDAKTSSSKTYSYVYSNEPVSLDYIQMNQTGTSSIAASAIDGLLENDKYGNLIPSLAKDWTVSKDGLTYTYKLRKGVKWYTAEGEEYADVKAQDFVTGIKHAVDTKSSALYVIQDSIKGLNDYIAGKSKDFSTVGVKALDDYTVQYTLNKPESYWNSKLTYSITFPVNADFLKSKGKDFGKVSDPDSLLYNGPYLLKSITAKSSMEFEKNPNYWDKKHVTIDNVKLTYYDGSDQESLFKNFDDGSYTTGRLFPTSPSYKTAEKKYGDDIIYSQQDGSTFMYFFNMNRTKYGMTKKTTDKQKSDTQAALRNKDFRQAVTFALDRGSWNAQTAGQEGKDKALRNALVPPTFVQADGKSFGSYVTSDLASYGDEWKGVNLDDAQDGLYNKTKAKAEFAKAKSALQAKGVSFPIQIDYPVDQTNNDNVGRAKSFKQSVESNLGKDNVQVNVIEKSSDEVTNATFQAETPEQQDYDITWSGWSPDFQDPSSDLDIFSTKEGAASTGKLGILPKDTALIKEIGLDKYQELLDKANSITDDVNARYQAYAKAQAWLTDSAITIPTVSNGASPQVTKVVPFTKAYSLVGVKGDIVYKGMELSDKPLTAKEYAKRLKKWQSEKEKSNQEYAKKLAEHVEK